MENKYTFILDVDGVLTDGTFYYTKEGKVAKKFGPDDNDALKLLRKAGVNVVFTSSDWRSFEISKLRVKDMGYELNDIKPGMARLNWIKENFGLENSFYMGDSFVDAPILKAVKEGITTSEACFLAKKYANYVTMCVGGHRAVSEYLQPDRAAPLCRYVPGTESGGVPADESGSE